MTNTLKLRQFEPGFLANFQKGLVELRDRQSTAGQVVWAGDVT